MRNQDSSRHSTVGANLRQDADRSLQRATLFGFILILAHLLEIQPSEIDFGGAKFNIKDSSVVYGSLALLFGYFMSRAVQQSDLASAYLPGNEDLLKKRMIILAVRRSNKKRAPPKEVKSTAKNLLFVSGIVLLPYRTILTFILLSATITAGIDVFGLGEYVWDKSRIVKEFRQTLEAS